MKKGLYHIVLLFILFICMNGCEKESHLPPIDIVDIQDCHYGVLKDSITMREILLGEWNWEYVSCFWTPEKANYTENEGMVVQLYSDCTLNVNENGKITKTANWKLINIEPNYFQLETDPRIDELQGYILVCNDRIVFFYSYIDLCDNYFTRLRN